MDKNRGQRREVGIIDTPIELITAQEARDMAMHSDVDYIEKAVEKQLSAVNQTIMEAAQCGFYTAYYKSELYPQVESLLKECGYNTEKLYEDHELVGRTPIRIFKGTHISWNWRDKAYERTEI